MSKFKLEHWEAYDEYIITKDDKPYGNGTYTRKSGEIEIRKLEELERD